ncbi:MAG: DNA2/NAM7 family helicase, partial [Bacteroidaceae bacterium]|nr:DNA2/NAM7 family helicase [Bacteroidaceae bacterium]
AALKSVSHKQDRKNITSDISVLSELKSQRALRCVVSSIQEDVVMVNVKDFPHEEPLRLICNQNEQTIDALSRLTEGMQLSVANYKIKEQGICPELIIIEPDFLVDITSLTGCVKPYGDSALNYLLAKFEQDETTAAILLGNVANQFLDDLVNNPSTDYNESIRKAFRGNMLAFSTCENGIDASFFQECKSQFVNIKSMVEKLYADPNFIGAEGNVILEPTFFCPNLGVQGRFDFLQGDMKNIIELKSGKWDDFHKCAKDEHVMQMILYKEILYQNLGVKQSSVGGYLLYSKYPYLQEQRTAREMVHRMMTLRNKIVMLEYALKDGKAKDLLDSVTADDLRLNNCSDKLWFQYIRPRIESQLKVIQNQSELMKEYFYTFVRFIAKEHVLSKIGDGRVESTRGMSSLWNADQQTKISNGDMLVGLHIMNILRNPAIYSIQLVLPETDKSMPNFRVGDSVILYQKNNQTDSVANRQVIRCCVEEMDVDTITLQIKFPQLNGDLFPLDASYAVEHDFQDSAVRSQYQALVKFASTSQDKQDLLLCQRKPQFDEAVTLNRHYINSHIDDIVLRAKQAKDYFLLVGPPGTGKTSVALRSMVEEFLSSGQTVLLLSYTNRAVDEICEQLDCDYIRIGRELSCSPLYRTHLLNNVVKENNNRNEVRKALMDVPVVVSTVNSMVSHADIFKLRSFDVTIIDEASQILEPQIIGLLTQVNKFIMIGDHKQLPAVVVQDESSSVVKSSILHDIGLTNCRNSLFERLYDRASRCSYEGEVSPIAMLDHQGRMHPEIAEFVNENFYEKKLVAVPVKHQTEELPYKIYDEADSFIATTRIGFIDIPLPPVTERQPKLNQYEADVIADIVEKLIELHAKNGIEFDPITQIGIIVPFRRQIAAVRTALSSVTSLGEQVNDMMIDTVERYQGSQRDIIIYGTTITRPYELDILSNIVCLGDLLVDRKLNVAITRARKQLFILGNKRLLRVNQLYSLLIEAAEKNI